MNPFRFLVSGIVPVGLICLVTACSNNPDPDSLKQTLLCDGNEGVTPFEVRCEYFYLDQNNYRVEPDEDVVWTLDIALEGIAQRFYSQSTGKSFTTEIDRPGAYTLTAAISGRKSSIILKITDPDDSKAVRTRQVPVMISSGKREKQERILDAAPGYEIIDAAIAAHPNTSRVSSRVSVPDDRTSARLVVEFQPKLEAFKNVVNAWFAGNVVLTERQISH